MLLKSKDIAFIGILMAIGVILVTAGGYFEGSTLFFLAAASFLVGIVQRSLSVAASAAFLAGTTVLSFFFSAAEVILRYFSCFWHLCYSGGIYREDREGKEKKSICLGFKGCFIPRPFCGRAFYCTKAFWSGKPFWRKDFFFLTGLSVFILVCGNRLCRGFLDYF